MARSANGNTMLFNPNTTAVVYDTEGRIVAGGARVEVGEVDAVGQEAIDHNLLVLEEPERRDRNADHASPDEAPAAKAPGASAPKKTT